MSLYPPDLSIRLAEPPEGCPCEKIEVEFGIPITLSRDHHNRLHQLINDIVASPWNQPKNGVHWVGYEGGRLNMSVIDSVLMGRPAGPNPPANGEEPECDDTVLVIGAHARGFHDAQERQEVELEREGLGYCSVCWEPQAKTPAGLVCQNGHGGAATKSSRPRHRP